MKFEYQAKGSDGTITRGIGEALDKFSLARELKKESKQLLTAKELVDRSFFSNLSFSIGGVGAEQKMVFTRNLAAMIHAGIPLSRSITILGKQTENTKFKACLEAINESIRKGEPLSEAMKKFPEIFSSFVISLIKVGEETGRLPNVLKEISENLEKNLQLVRKIRGVMIYPSIVFGIIIIIGIIMFMYVVPTLTATFRDLKIELPTSTRAIIAVSDFLSSHTIASLFIMLAIIAGGIAAYQSRRGKDLIDLVLIKLPVIKKITQEINSARTARTLSSLFNSGISVNQSLEITKDVIQNHFYREMLVSARMGVEKGQTLSSFFKSNPNLYPTIVGEMIAVGEETGSSGEMFSSIAEFYEEEVDRKTKNLSTIIEPLLMVIVGVAVGFFAVAMISPIYSISTTF